MAGSRASKVRSPVRRLFWPAVTTALMLALATGLGIWQLERLRWKEGLLAEIDRAEQAAPVALPAEPEAFEKVSVAGSLRDGKVARYGSEVRNVGGQPVLGSQVVRPLWPASGPPILVDLGWWPDARAVPERSGGATIVGYVRPAETGSVFAPGPDVAGLRFWALDPQRIGAALGLAQVAPFTLVRLGSSDGGPEPATALPRPPNDHLGYAITWFSLAAALLVIFAVYTRRSLRR